jgi:hypothetical protein
MIGAIVFISIVLCRFAVPDKPMAGPIVPEEKQMKPSR